MTATRLLVVASTAPTASAWCERNARFTVGFDRVVQLAATEVEIGLAGVDPFDGVVIVRDLGPARTERSGRLLSALRHVTPEAAIVVAPAPRDALTAAAPPEGMTRTVAEDGWGGVMRTGEDLTLVVDGQVMPVVRWDLPLYRADALLLALEVLDEIGDLLHAHSGEGPNGWADERKALGQLLDSLVDLGRARRDERGDIAASAAHT
ncbi:hypothetical protein ACK8HX_02170 [Oryzobacter sp. R7]|uniref:hypothetical protein n=1 Tax=Oryzobacter faecalis TaxID=3388656 RepID=UPI00398C9593